MRKSVVQTEMNMMPGVTSEKDILYAFQSDDEWLTMGQIAARVFRTNHPGLRRLVKGLHERGALKCMSDQMPNGATRYLYCFPGRWKWNGEI